VAHSIVGRFCLGVLIVATSFAAALPAVAQPQAGAESRPSLAVEADANQ
jgi:hypothetical protein